MRNRFQNFMSGRYGGDALNQTIIIVALILVILNIFIRRTFWILYFVALALLVIYFLRMFSTNISRRTMENDRFVGFFSRFRGGSSGSRGNGSNRGYGRNAGYGGNGGNRDAYSRREDAERRKAQRQDSRYYKYFNCPNCNQKVRVPKGKGKIEITCPKCRTTFIRKT